MKNVLILSMVLALAGGVLADAANYGPGSPWGIAGNGLNPYGFDTDGNLTDTNEGSGENPDLWGTWGDSADGGGSVVVADGLCTIEVTTGGYELAFAHDNALVDLPLLPEAEIDDIEVVLTVVSVSGPGYITMKVEYYDDTDVFGNNDDGGGNVRIDDFEAAGGSYLITTPGVYSFKCSELGNGPIPVGTLAITSVITVAGGAGSTAVIDEIWIGKEGGYSTTKATNPSPKNGSAIGADPKPVLTWENPDPNNLDDTITSDVFLMDAGTEPLTEDPNMSDDLKDPGVYRIANDIIAESATIPSFPFGSTLQNDHYYYWAVNCTDPHGDPNGPVETLGDIWMFSTTDAAPIVDAGPDEFAWVSKEDGDSNSLEYTITVIGTYTDDGKTPISDANFVNLGWDIANGDDGILKVSQTWTHNGTGGTNVPPDIVEHTEGTVTAVYKTVDGTTAIPGWWDLQFQVTDDAGTGQDVVFVRVDEDCTAAAVADDSDTFDTTYDALGNRNCKNDLADFAAFALKWLDQSVKYE